MDKKFNLEVDLKENLIKSFGCIMLILLLEIFFVGVMMQQFQIPARMYIKGIIPSFVFGGGGHCFFCEYKILLDLGQI